MSASPLRCDCAHPTPLTDEFGTTSCHDCGCELERSPADGQTGLERLADAVAGRLAERQVTGGDLLVDAAELARLFGVHRKTVYRNKERYGVERLGDGPRARLRFDVE